MAATQFPRFFRCDPQYDSDMDSSIEELVETERECIARFRQKAQELRKADPKLTQEYAMAKAAELMPRTANRYLYARQRLQFMGVPALPLR